MGSSAKVYRGVLVGDKVIVPSIEDSRELYANGFYGRPMGSEKVKDPNSISSPLVLSPLEAVYLVSRGLLEVVDERGNPVSADELKRAIGFAERQEGLLKVYSDLRSMGLVVRSGLKYGAAFVAYRRGPGLEHAPFVIHYYEPNTLFDPVELVRAGRLSHSVRKTFIVATLDPEGGRPHYIMLKWLRP